jgi:hypothetical protein
MDDADPTVPDHLRPLLGAAAELELEYASDGFWPDGPDERAQYLDRLMRAARTVDACKANRCSRQEVATLAGTAVGEQQPSHWPRTIKEAGDLIELAVLTRDLILLRDAAGGMPTQEELDEPL